MAIHIGRGWRIALIILTVLIIVILFLPVFLKPIITNKLKSAVLTGSDSLYQIGFSKADINIWKGSAILYEARLSADTGVYRRLQKAGSAPAEVFQVKVGRLVISGAKLFRLYFKKELEIGEISLDRPQVQLSRYPVPKDNNPKPEQTLYAKLKPALRSIRVGSIRLRDINASYTDHSKARPETYRLKEMNLIATDLLIDSATQTDPTRSLFCRDIVTDLHHFSYQNADGLYRTSFDSLRLSTRTARLVLSGFRVEPVPAAAFFARNKKKRDRYALQLATVTLRQFDLQAFRKKQQLDIRQLVVDKGSLEIYSNPQGKPQKTDRLVTYPVYALRHLSTALRIDTLDVRQITVVLTMVNKKTQKAGSIRFVNTSGRFLNITNQAGQIRAFPNTSVALRTYLLGKGRLDFGFRFSLTDPAYSYRYYGHLGPMVLSTGNTVLVPLALLKVNSGNLQSLDFDIRSDARTSRGRVTFLYQDLKIEMLRAGKNGYERKGLVSFLANLIVIKNNNPGKPGETPRRSEVIYDRPPLVPFFGSIWQTLLSGIKPAVGAGK